MNQGVTIVQHLGFFITEFDDCEIRIRQFLHRKPFHLKIKILSNSYIFGFIFSIILLYFMSVFTMKILSRISYSIFVLGINLYMTTYD